MSLRFRVAPESITGHCCFSHSVVDEVELATAKNKGGAVGVMCECFSEVDAQRIADALNKAIEVKPQ